MSPLRKSRARHWSLVSGRCRGCVQLRSEPSRCSIGGSGTPLTFRIDDDDLDFVGQRRRKRGSPVTHTIPRTDFRKPKKRCARSGGASRARFRSVGLTLGVSVAAVSVIVSGRNVVPEIGCFLASRIFSKAPRKTGHIMARTDKVARQLWPIYAPHRRPTSAPTRTARNASARPSRASPSGPGLRSSMSSMMQRSPVRTPSRHARASRPFWIGSRATACVPSSSRMPAGSRAS